MSNYFQILACNQVVGTCCSDYGLVNILNILKQFLDIIQILAPILLMVALVIRFTKMTVLPPKDGNGMKGLYNAIAATVIIFFLPFVMDLVLGIIPDTFQVGACWKTAAASKEAMNLEINSGTFYNTSDTKKKKVLIDPNKYDEPKGSSSNNSSSSVKGSSTGKAIVQLAKSYVGNSYCWGGKDPNVCADCSGFVSYIFKQFGINLTSQTAAMWADTSKYTLVSANNIQAGDVVMYNGHVGILTGNGNEMVHASSPKEGIKISSDYRYRSIRGIMRINGVN